MYNIDYRLINYFYNMPSRIDRPRFPGENEPRPKTGVDPLKLVDDLFVVARNSQNSGTEFGGKTADMAAKLATRVYRGLK